MTQLNVQRPPHHGSRRGICLNCPTDIDLLGPCTISLFANAYRWFRAGASEFTLSYILAGLPIWLTVKTPCAHPTGQTHPGGLSLRSPQESSTVASNDQKTESIPQH